MPQQSDIAYRNKEKNARLELAHKAAIEANTVSRTTSGQLLLIAGAILTFSSAALSNTSLLVGLSDSWKWCVVASWILFAISALISVCYLLSDYHFFLSWERYHSKVAEKIVAGLTPDAAAKALEGKRPIESTSLWPLYVQTVLIFTGLVLLLAAIARSLLASS